MRKPKRNNVNRGPTSLRPEYRSERLGWLQPLIYLQHKFTPSWIGWFTFAITFSWLLYGVYMRIEPGLTESSHFKRYYQRQFPDLDIFGESVEAVHVDDGAQENIPDDRSARRSGHEWKVPRP